MKRREKVYQLVSFLDDGSRKLLGVFSKPIAPSEVREIEPGVRYGLIEIDAKTKQVKRTVWREVLIPKKLFDQARTRNLEKKKEERKTDLKRLRSLPKAWEKLTGFHTIEKVAQEVGLAPNIVDEVYKMLELIRLKGLYPIRFEGVERLYFVKKVTI